MLYFDDLDKADTERKVQEVKKKNPIIQRKI